MFSWIVYALSCPRMTAQTASLDLKKVSTWSWQQSRDILVLQVAEVMLCSQWWQQCYKPGTFLPNVIMGRDWLSGYSEHGLSGESSLSASCCLHALETGEQMLGNEDLATSKISFSAITYMEEKSKQWNGTVKIEWQAASVGFFFSLLASIENVFVAWSAVGSNVHRV